MSKKILGSVLFTILCISTFNTAVLAQVQSGTKSSSLLNMQPNTYYQNTSGATQEARSINQTAFSASTLQQTPDVTLKVDSPTPTAKQTTQASIQNNNLYLLLMVLAAVLVLVWVVYYVLSKKPKEQPPEQEIIEPRPKQPEEQKQVEQSTKIAKAEKSNKKARRRRQKRKR